MELRWSPITPRGLGPGYHGIAAPQGVRTLTWYDIIITDTIIYTADVRCSGITGLVMLE